MFKRFATIFVAPIIAVLGFTAAASASTAVTGASIASHDVSGYQLSGRNFRYVQTFFKLPTTAQCEAMANISPDGFGAAVTLGPAEESNAGVTNPPDASALGISMVPSASGCGLISPAFNTNIDGPVRLLPFSAVTLNPGDEVELSLFYDQVNLTTLATLKNLTDPQTATGTFAASAHYTKASATAGFGPYTPAGTVSRLFLFTGSRATTYPGNRGSFGNGPWTHSRVIMINGGVIDVSPGSFWNSGMNFAVRTH